MTEQEFKEQFAKIEEDRNVAKRQLYIKYAKDQEKFAVGDIISDTIRTILVNRITAYVSFDNIPMPAYHGKVLKKDLTPKKNNSTEVMYGNHGITLIKKADQTERIKND